MSKAIRRLTIRASTDQGHTRSRRDRGEYSSCTELARTRRDHEALYEEARLTRLGTEKFMLDGRHTGTGGGNHIVLGAATPADSPFLRRPDLLKSIVGVLAEPSLAVLSVLGAVHRAHQPGPAHRRSAPRYALRNGDRIRRSARQRLRQRSAMARRPHLPQSPDRRQRQHPSHGNLHRQALFARRADRTPRSGRIPRFRNAAASRDESGASSLLLRALIARFWKTPYAAKLVRWGTALHDKFMLPHFVWADFSDVIAI